MAEHIQSLARFSKLRERDLPPKNTKELCLHNRRASIEKGNVVKKVVSHALAQVGAGYSWVDKRTLVADSDYGSREDETYFIVDPIDIDDFYRASNLVVSSALSDFFETKNIALDEKTFHDLLRVMSTCIMRVKTHDLWEKTRESLQAVESFVLRANRLALRGSVQAALDLIYDNVDELMCKGEFDQLDGEIKDIQSNELTLDILLAILTSTLPAKNKLHSRKKFFDSTVALLKSRGEYEEDLLLGLE